jgi:hypothetical protein
VRRTGSTGWPRGAPRRPGSRAADPGTEAWLWRAAPIGAVGVPGGARADPGRDGARWSPALSRGERQRRGPRQGRGPGGRNYRPSVLERVGLGLDVLRAGIHG